MICHSPASGDLTEITKSDFNLIWEVIVVVVTLNKKMLIKFKYNMTITIIADAIMVHLKK